MTLTPKQDFLARNNGHDAGRHAEVVANPAFKEACQVALLEMTLGLDMNDGRSILMVKGAKVFAEELINLATPTKPQVHKLEEHLIPV